MFFFHSKSNFGDKMTDKPFSPLAIPPNLLQQIAPSAEPSTLSTKVLRPLIPTPNRQERSVVFGIDCAENVHFTHW